MGIFKKKRNADDNFAQDVPQFKPFSDEEHTKLPELPKAREKKEMFPSYESEFSGIKKEIQKPVFSAPPKHVMPKPQPEARRAFPKPEPVVERDHVSGDKPIYVKVDQYKEAMASIEKIKELCNEADKKLSEISKLRANEDRELEKWQEDVDKIKEKLLQIDKRLFEV